MKLAVTGKGGVGKTTLSALLIRHFAEKGKRVIAVDADPDANLASALGFDNADEVVPISEMDSLIEERTGAKPGTIGSFFKLNPKVDDLPEKLWKEKEGIKRGLGGPVKRGGGGCICPESAILKTMIQNLLLFRKEAVVMDMEAGIEHLGRATAQAVDRLIVVVEPGKRSLETALKIKELADDIKLTRISLVANKIQCDDDRAFIKDNTEGLDVLGYLPFDDTIRQADMNRMPPWQLSPQSLEKVREITEKLVKE